MTNTAMSFVWLQTNYPSSMDKLGKIYTPTTKAARTSPRTHFVSQSWRYPIISYAKVCRGMAPAENGIHSILSANDADHSRYRRLLSHAFSDRALRQQEPLLLRYIRSLIHRLRERASPSSDEIVDMVQWLNFTTFDIVGDLSLGESFGGLEQGRYHGWIAVIFTQFKLAALAVSFRFFGLDKVLRAMLPKSAIEKRRQHANTANEKIHRRLDQGSDAGRNDFMTYVLRYNDEKGMSVLEIEATFRALVVAGSETTATALTGILGKLLQNPETFQTLATEIRQSFSDESEIRAEKVDKIKYLDAVIEEGLRLCPPVALGMPRLVPEGITTVSSYPLPGGVCSYPSTTLFFSPLQPLTRRTFQIYVSASGYASNRSELNFPDSPSKFDPSRWLPPSSVPKSGQSAFNPFSLGPRNCLGRNLAYLELRLILSHLLWAFDFELADKEWSWEKQKSWILWEKTPLNVRLKDVRR